MEIHAENSGNWKLNPYLNFTAGAALVTMHLELNHINEMTPNNLQCKQSINSYMTIIESALHFKITETPLCIVA